MSAVDSVEMLEYCVNCLIEWPSGRVGVKLALVVSIGELTRICGISGSGVIVLTVDLLIVCSYLNGIALSGGRDAISQTMSD